VHILNHIILIVLSALTALSLPYTANFIAKKFLAFWALIENEKIFLVSIEIVCAMVLILFFNYLGRIWKNRKLVAAAKKAGLFYAPSRKGFFSEKMVKKLKTRQGIARDIMLIGSTGFRTFVNPKSDLHEAIMSCRDAKIILLNPFSEGASVRSKSISEPGITMDHFRSQIKKSIKFLKEIHAVSKNIRLKLYSDIPFLKLTILGDYIWVQHYHAGLDVRFMPEYAFKHNQNSSGFYSTFYQYFLTKWNDIEIPEYDFDTQELIFKDKTGNDIKRGNFNLNTDHIHENNTLKTDL